MPLRLIYGCVIDHNTDYHLTNGSVIDGWTLINIRLRKLVEDGPFEVLYYGDHSQRGWALVYETLATSAYIDMHLIPENFKLKTDLLPEYKQLLQAVKLDYADFKPQLLALIG